MSTQIPTLCDDGPLKMANGDVATFDVSRIDNGARSDPCATIFGALVFVEINAISWFEINFFLNSTDTEHGFQYGILGGYIECQIVSNPPQCLHLLLRPGINVHSGKRLHLLGPA